MECVVDPTVDYLSIRFAAEQQRVAVEQKIATLTNSHVVHPGIDKRARANQEIPGLEESSWEPAILECTLHGQQQPLQKCLQVVFNAIHSHDDAWPFRQSVSVKEAPDYYHVIKDPIDLSLIQRKLENNFYASVAMFLADVCRMCENCRLYNGDTETGYWDYAVRLETYARGKCAEISSRKRKMKIAL